MIDTLFFDFSGTLVKGEFEVSSCRKAVAKILASRGYPVTLPQYNLAMESALMWRKGISRGGRIEISSGQLEMYALNLLNITPSRDLMSEIQDIEFEHYHWRLFPDAREMLQEISSEYRLAIISNSRSSSPLRVLKEEGLLDLFEEVILSKDVGFRKPDSRIFEYALNRMNIQASEAIFIGDSFLKDVKGASEIGLYTVWLTDEKDYDTYETDAVVSELKEIPHVIRKLTSHLNDLAGKPSLLVPKIRTNAWSRRFDLHHGR